MRMNFIVIGSIVMALTVVLGAFGAHILKERLGVYEMNIYEKAVNYQGIHGLGLILIGILQLQFPQINLKSAGVFILLGILFFSGSLYLLSLKEISFTGSMTKVLGPITPLGGLCFIVGWLILGFKLIQKK